MKTLQEIKDQVARNHSFTDWSHVLKAHSGRLNLLIEMAMQLYAREKCKEQREICADQYHTWQPVIGSSTVSDKIKNAPEPTML